ncbi:hypothetical protein ME763_37695 (plasmid) [Streptomyces murinus]|uniref:hypothetical protein n=1 Tax=Streptomyces murinus TaxID=33900 RepID=UPI000A1FBD41|nr:hypothetical protein [Streptomyces murinus]WDO11251.1 hypothetical protein ME763_37695 [Streptomyces murinus]
MTVTELDFPPIINGVDYLSLVVDLLAAADPPGPRELKYAVLHLHAAAEVLLKARLQREHWTLVFDDPRKATRRAFESGNFTSCTMGETLTRLKEIAQVPFTTADQNTLKNLSRDRNALQHYGLTHNARAVEARAGQALDFLVRFIHDGLMPVLDDDEMTVSAFPWAEMNTVTKGVRKIGAYRTERRKRLLGTLKDVKHRTLRCHECGEMALVIGDRCHFCGFPIGGFHPEAVADMVLVYRRIAEGGPDPQEMIEHCPRCTFRSLAPDITTAASDQPAPFCFRCADSILAGTGTATRKPEERP